MNHDTLVGKFAQTVGVEKAERLVCEALAELGIDRSERYSAHEIVDICETIQRSTEGYLRLVAAEIRVQQQADRRFSALLDELADPVVTVRFEGTEPIVTGMNAAFRDVFGYDESVQAESLPSLIVPEGKRAEATDQWLRSDADGIEVERVTADGQRRTFIFRTAIVTRERGSVEGYGIYTDITERKRREGQLELQNERLDRFASVISHDLRNPLQVARGHLSLAQEGATGRTADHLADMADAHERMEQLIDDLLALARQESVVEQTDPVRLQDVARDAWSLVDTAEATLSCVDCDGRVRADPSRLQQLLANLISNAVEHGSTGAGDTDGATGGPDIRVGMLPDGGGFYVADDGQGIPPDERDRIFDHGYSTSDEGTGFGLAIVTAIVEAHEWSISVTDSADGGARFEISDVETQPP